MHLNKCKTLKKGENMLYNEVHLTDLRRFAKKIGVKSPTKYKKDKLIEKILEIEKGLVEPCYSTKGRPAKVKKLVETSALKEVPVNSCVDIDVVYHMIKRTKEFLIELQKEIEQIKKEQTD